MTDDILYFDVESTTFQKGHAFSRPNRLMCVGTLFRGLLRYHDIEHSGKPYREALEEIRQLFAQAKLVVGFNIKFDLHWARVYIPDLVIPPVWDCQLGEFILSHQKWVMPNLEETLSKYGLPPKLDIVKRDYWDQGINTDQVPADVLQDYVLGDIVNLPQIYEKQLVAMSAKQQVLARLQMEDLLSLEEQEFNGLCFDLEEAARLEKETHARLDQIILELNDAVGTDVVNWNSGHHCSAVLYGGGVNYVGRETVLKTLKSGKVKSSERNCYRQAEFPQLVAPLRNTEYSDTAKKTDQEIDRENAERELARKPKAYRHWSTGESELKSLRPKGKQAKLIISLMLKQAELEKLRGSLAGIPKLMTEYQWRDGLLHGQLNQCVAITGRIASAKPNLQNFDAVMKILFPSRYPSH